MNRQLSSELHDAVKRMDADEAIGCIVITGAGERAFSAGGDIHEQREDDRRPADRSSQQFDHLPQRLRADFAAQAHPCSTAKCDLDDALAFRPPRPTVTSSTAIRRDLDRHHCAAFDHCFRQQLPPPSEQLVAVHIRRRATIDTDAPGACVSDTIWRFNASEYCRRFIRPGCCLVSTKPVVDTCST